jgi:hypothetical protein
MIQLETTGTAEIADEPNSESSFNTSLEGTPKFWDSPMPSLFLIAGVSEPWGARTPAHPAELPES